MYCIDTSALLHAWNDRYPIEIFTSLWNNLDSLIENEKLFAPIEVYRELERKDDEIYEWVNQRQKMFMEPNDEVQEEIKTIVNNFPRFVENYSPDGIWADPYLIAHTKVIDCILITGETKAGPRANKIRIPDVCEELEVDWMNILGLIKKEEWSF